MIGFHIMHLIKSWVKLALVKNKVNSKWAIVKQRKRFNNVLWLCTKRIRRRTLSKQKLNSFIHFALIVLLVFKSTYGRKRVLIGCSSRGLWAELSTVACSWVIKPPHIVCLIDTSCTKFTRCHHLVFYYEGLKVKKFISLIGLVTT